MTKNMKEAKVISKSLLLIVLASGLISCSVNSNASNSKPDRNPSWTSSKASDVLLDPNLLEFKGIRIGMSPDEVAKNIEIAKCVREGKSIKKPCNDNVCVEDYSCREDVSSTKEHYKVVYAFSNKSYQLYAMTYSLEWPDNVKETLKAQLLKKYGIPNAVLTTIDHYAKLFCWGSCKHDSMYLQYGVIDHNGTYPELKNTIFGDIDWVDEGLTKPLIVAELSGGAAPKDITKMSLTLINPEPLVAKYQTRKKEEQADNEKRAKAKNELKL